MPSCDNLVGHVVPIAGPHGRAHGRARDTELLAKEARAKDSLLLK